MKPGTLEDHIKREHNINDSLAIKTLVNMTTDNHVDIDTEINNTDTDTVVSIVSSTSSTSKFYVTDEIVTDKDDHQPTNLQNKTNPAQHNHCCGNANDSKINTKFECNWCMKTYNCRFHRNFHENKCNLTYELEKQDPGNADEISLSVFGVRFRCPLCEYHCEKRKDVRDHIVDFHQGYSKRSGEFIELHPIRQEMRIFLGRRPMKKVTKTYSKHDNRKRKSVQNRTEARSNSIIVESESVKEQMQDPISKQTSQLKVNKQLTDEIKAEINEIEREFEDDNSIFNEVSIEVDNDVNDEVKVEIQSEPNNDMSLTYNSIGKILTEDEEPICPETEEIAEQLLNSAEELVHSNPRPGKNIQPPEDQNKSMNRVTKIHTNSSNGKRKSTNESAIVQDQMEDGNELGGISLQTDKSFHPTEEIVKPMNNVPKMHSELKHETRTSTLDKNKSVIVQGQMLHCDFSRRLQTDKNIPPAEEIRKPMNIVSEIQTKPEIRNESVIVQDPMEECNKLSDISLQPDQNIQLAVENRKHMNKVSKIQTEHVYEKRIYIEPQYEKRKSRHNKNESFIVQKPMINNKYSYNKSSNIPLQSDLDIQPDEEMRNPMNDDTKIENKSKYEKSKSINESAIVQDQMEGGGLLKCCFLK